MRRLLSVSFLAAILLALALAGLKLADNGGAGPASAQPSQAVSIDMDPEDNPPAGFNHGTDPNQATFSPFNTASSIGPRQACARINENDVLDADEDAAADQLIFDITIENVTAPGAIGFSTRMFYSEVDNLRVFSINPNLFLGQIAGSSVQNFSEATPDADNNNEYRIDLLDIGDSATTAETGTGTMVRVTIETKSDVATGLYPLDLDETVTYYVDGNGDPVPAEPPDPDFAIRDATLAVNQDCPVPTDVKVTAVTTVSPASSPINTPFNVTVDATLHNNGGLNPVNVDTAITLNVPPDCTVSGGNSVTVQDTSLAVSTATLLPTQTFSVQCSQPSSHSFTATATATIDDAGATESDPSNNSLTSAASTTAVTAESDAKITSQVFQGVPADKCPTSTSPGCTAALPFPPVISGGPTINFSVKKTVHNNGGFGPTNVDVTPISLVSTATGGGLTAADCTVSPISPTQDLSLAVSTSVDITENISFSCTDTSGSGMGWDDDADGFIDEDRIDGVNNDGDALTDEDSPFLLPTVCVQNQVAVDQQHVSDPNPANNVALTCKTFLLERPFTPSASVIQSSTEGPGNLADLPTTDDCQVTQPCEQRFISQIPGGQPLAGVVNIIPDEYYITRGHNDPVFLDSIPNGELTARTSFLVNLMLSPASVCGFPLAGTLDLKDGALPAAAGEGPDTGPGNTLTQLVDPNSWPKDLEASPLYQAFAIGLGAPIWQRITGLEPVTGTAINVLIFNLGPSGWAQFAILGNPANPPTPAPSAPQACTPFNTDTDYLGITSGGLPIRICNEIRGGTDPADFHFIATQYTRTDTGQQVTKVDPNLCTGDNDVSITKSDNLNVVAPADLDHTETITINVQNGNVPSNVDVSVSLIGPAVCDPRLVPQPGDGNTTPDVLTGPTVVGGQQSTRLDFTELAMGANELRTVTRDYVVNCPLGGPYQLQVVVSASSPLPDPNPTNNQDENHPVVTVNDDDLDDDTVVNSVDNCPADPNPGQQDTDGDGLGDACDSDIDGDGIDNSSDACPSAAEDFDGKDDADGCPDTDAGISSVLKDPDYDVDVSMTVTQNVRTEVANQGNIVASLELTLLLKSKVGVCEARWIPRPGDGSVNDNVGGTLFSQLTIVLPNMLPGEVREVSRDYTVHCFSKSFHDNAVVFEAGVVPVYPVAEENVGGPKPNVHKQNIDITAWAVADVKKLGLIIADPPFAVSENEPITVTSVFHNNGPFGPVTVLDDIVASAPPDCTVTPASILGTPVVLPVSVTVTLDQNFVMHCTKPSNHTFTWVDTIAISDVHVRDPNPNNNSATFSVTNPVTTTADPKVTGVAVAFSGGTLKAGQNFNVTVTGTLHNNGPYGPLSGNATISLSVPAGCTRVPNGSQTVSGVNLPVSSATNVSATWLVNCANPSNHQFTGTVALTPNLPLHVSDSNTENNSGSGGTVLVITIDADKDITSLNVQQEPKFLDAEGAAGVEDRRAADPGDINNDAANVSSVPVVQGVSYEFFARVATLAITATPPYTLTLSYASTDGCTGLSANDVINEPAEAAGTVNVIKRPFTATLPAGDPDCTVTVTASLSAAHHVNDPDTDVLTAVVGLCADQDQDGVSTSSNVELCGPIDNCPTVFNPGQQDSDGDGIGDACDSTPNHDVGVKYCLKFGPAPVNLSDNGGSYMWVLCEIGNFSGHHDVVTITGPASLLQSTLPNGCTASTALLIPGQTNFILFAGEQKFVLYRTKFECHEPATQQVIPITIKVSIDHVQQPPDGDDLNSSNDSVTITQNINIGPPPPP